MKALLVNPSQPETFMSYKYALGFVRKKAALPPLGLLTVAALLPERWSKKVVDMNVEPLTSAHLEWADLVLVSAMIVQKDSALKVLARAGEQGVTTIAGGPLFTHLNREIEGVDHFVIGEAEESLPILLQDLDKGTAKQVYRAEDRPDLALSPIPAWELAKLELYHSLSLQYSRGCPFDCEFCDIVGMFGRRPRFKSPSQVLDELDRLFSLGWRGEVMFVDDNFIGGKARAQALLKRLADWQKEHGYPFTFNTQASVNLSRHPGLMALMAEANLTSVFLGIETPALESLRECGKNQNRKVDLVAAVKTIQSWGISVSGGFIIGFDSDPESIFEDQISFIERAGIPTAMVGLLSVGPGTRLFNRLRDQGRLLGLPSGCNTTDTGALNFIPKMDRERLIAGYKSVLTRLYEPKAYYRRVLAFLKRSNPTRLKGRLPDLSLIRRNLAAAIRIFWRLGVIESGRRAFWGFLVKVGLTRPRMLTEAMGAAANGYHFKKMTAAFVSEERV